MGNVRDIERLNQTFHLLCMTNYHETNASGEMHNTRLVYTKGEAAKLLQVTTRTIERWIGRGLIPFIKIGSTVRIPANALNQLLETSIKQ